ncbi:phosphotransferase enzyme family protein, partial [Cardiosporidium cionae]
MELSSTVSSTETLLPKALSTLKKYLPNYFGASVFPPTTTESLTSLLDPISRCNTSFKVTLIKGGITNSLLKVTHPEASKRACLIRYYGPKTEHIINRDKERALGIYLENFGIGKKVYTRFEGGQIEEWIWGRSIESNEMGDEQLMPFIAKKLAELHCLYISPTIYVSHYHHINAPMPENLETTSLLWETIWKYYTLCEDKIKEDHPRFKRLTLFNFDAIYQILMEIEDSAKALQSPISICHCDLLSGNIVKLDEGGVEFIDFEYGMPAERAFDIANHFNEYAGFECHWKNFPSETQQRAFLECYAMNHRDKPSVEKLMKETHAFLPVSHCYWGLWSLVQALYSDINFDFW